MTRCGCAGLTCSCLLESDTAGTTTIHGEGTLANPYVISANRGHVTVADTPTIDMMLGGQGTEGQPYVVSANLHANLENLQDVSLPQITPTGNVLAWDGMHWTSQPPSTAPVGAVFTGQCLTGDGSSASPLDPVLAPGGGLTCGTNGLSVVFPQLPNTVPRLDGNPSWVIAGTYNPNVPVLMNWHGRYDVVTGADGKFALNMPAGATCILGIHCQPLQPNANVVHGLVYEILLNSADSPNPLQAIRITATRGGTAFVSQWASLGYVIYYQR